MAEVFMLQHREARIDARSDDLTAEFPSFEDACCVADAQWATSDHGMTRQAIIDLSTGDEWVRADDGTWLALGPPPPVSA